MGKIERQKMEEINHAKLQFFTNITHELLTPLSIISASVDELKQEVPASSSVCPVIADNTVRLIRLIQQILEFSGEWQVAAESLAWKCQYVLEKISVGFRTFG